MKRKKKNVSLSQMLSQEMKSGEKSRMQRVVVVINKAAIAMMVLDGLLQLIIARMTKIGNVVIWNENGSSCSLVLYQQ